MTDIKRVPVDLGETYSIFRASLGEIADGMSGPFHEWMAEFHEAVREWKHEDGPEPDWDAFRESAKDLIDEEMMF